MLRRQAFALPTHRAAASYVARRDTGRTVIAGYSWFTDWGRDTFIVMHGFMMVPGGREPVRAILLAWAGTEQHGMLPNRFPDAGAAPEFNSVDAALWFVVAVHEFLMAAGQPPAVIEAGEEATLRGAVGRIIDGYRQGSRYGIRVDGDGLLAAGEPGVQLTWMDAKVGDLVVTARLGKPVGPRSAAPWRQGSRSSSPAACSWMSAPPCRCPTAWRSWAAPFMAVPRDGQLGCGPPLVSPWARSARCSAAG